MRLLESDIRRLAEEGFPAERFSEHENNHLYLGKGPDGCVFQKGTVCTVHDHRPLACRTYPWVDDEGTVRRDPFCPHGDEFDPPPDIEATLRDLVTRLEVEQHARNICISHSCHACCLDTEMPLTMGDIRRITGLGFHDFYHDRDGELILVNRDHLCFFLDHSGRCSIYEARPEGCRFYPFILGKGGVVMDRDCPHRDDHRKRLESWIEEGLYELVGRLEEEREIRLRHR